MRKIIVLAIIFMMFPDGVNAANVKWFNGANIQLVNGAGVPVGLVTPLPLFAATNYVIPWNTNAILTVTGNAIVPGQNVEVEMYDEDGSFDPDDLLDQHVYPSVPANGAFTATLHIGCNKHYTIFGGWAAGDVALSSGEFEAEIYIKDGNQRIPVGNVWNIRCGGRLDTPAVSLNTIGFSILGISLMAITFLNLRKRKYKLNK